MTFYFLQKKCVGGHEKKTSYRRFHFKGTQSWKTFDKATQSENASFNRDSVNMYRYRIEITFGYILEQTKDYQSYISKLTFSYEKSLFEIVARYYSISSVNVRKP